MIGAFTTAFPDLHSEKVRSFGRGEWVCGEFVITGTHKGSLQGPGGKTVPAAGKVVQFPLCIASKFEGGEIVEYHGYFDRLGFLAQLGLGL